MIQQIQHQRERLAEMLMKYCASQKELWQQVPYWALEADGRSGYSDQLQQAYAHKIWRLLGASGYYALFIDLATGTLFTQGGNTRPRTELLLQLDPKVLDANQILEQLRKDAQHPYPSYYKPEENDAHREQARVRWQVKPIHTQSVIDTIEFSYGLD